MQCQPSFHARTMERLDHSNTRRYISAFEDRLETASHPRLNYANRDREISSIRGAVPSFEEEALEREDPIARFLVRRITN